MARPVTLGSFQAMQRGEADALGDREIGTQDVATVDPLTGQLVDADSADDSQHPKDSAFLGVYSDENGKGDSTATPAVLSGSQSDWREIATKRAGAVVDVNPDGTVAEIRPAEMTPDRGDVTHHHTAADEERFSGGGTHDDYQQASLFLVPSDAAFNGKLYREAPELANIAERLIGEHGFLGQLEHCDIRWYWKRKTGVSKGRVKIGYCKRASDLLGHFTGADFLIWLSATTARDGKFTDRQVEAAVFHQLLHIGSDDNGNWIFSPHDFEGFAQEVRVFGTWTEGLKLGGTAFVAAHQMGLFDGTDEDEADDEDESLDDAEPIV